MINRLLFLILLFIPVVIKAQSKIVYDTLVVYDTLIVYDTIFLKENIALKSRILTSDLTSIVFDKKTATFFKTDIIVNENKQKTLAMKKITFLGILLFTLNHGLLAQTRLGVAAGALAWAVRDNDHHINNPVSGGFRFGIFSETMISNKFSIALAPTYYFLKGGADFKVTNYGEPVQWPAPIYINYINEDAHYMTQFFSSNRHQLAIAMKAIFTVKRFRPFAGLDFTSTFWESDEPYLSHRSRGDLGFIGGLSYRITNVMELDADYYLAFSKRQVELQNSTEVYAYGYQRLTFGVRYFLRTIQKKKAEE